MDMAYMNNDLAYEDEELARLVEQEMRQRQESLQLIAADSLKPVSIIQAQGSIFSVVAAEGYPGRRYHAGNKVTDILENLAIERAKQLFGAEHANVQPHSGTNANLAVYLGVLKPSDTVLAMSLREGGHLSHGYQLNASGQYYNFVFFGLNRETELVDYDEVLELARKHRPKMIVIGSSSYSRLWDWERLRLIADEVSAMLLADIAHISGLIAGKAIPSPVPYADFVTSTCYKTLCGGKGGFILCKGKFAKAIDRGVFPGTTSGVLMNNVAAKAVAFKRAMTPEFAALQRHIIKNAQALAKNLQAEDFRIVSGGTDNHRFLVDVRNKGIKGNKAEKVLEEAGIITNRNLIPYDPERPDVTSGLRLGPVEPSGRGMEEEEMHLIARMVSEALDNCENTEVLAKLREEVRELCQRFPLPSYSEKGALA